MKTLEDFKKAFTGLGLEFEVEEYGKRVVARHGFKSMLHADTSLTIDEGCGYMGFYCEFFFLDGVYLEHGCYE